MKQHAWEDDNHSRHWTHLNLIFKDKRRATIIGIEIDHARKVSWKMRVGDCMALVAVDRPPTIENFEAEIQLTNICIPVVLCCMFGKANDKLTKRLKFCIK